MFIYTLSHTNVTMKTTFAILGIIAAVALVTSLAAPNAFALTQTNGQASGQALGQSQISGLNLVSPQTGAQASVQSSIQSACVLVSIVCG